MTDAPSNFDESLFFDVSLDLLCVLGLDGYFRRLNPAWEQCLGYSREELMSRPFLDFVHPDDLERTRAQNSAVRGGSRGVDFENRYLHKDGSARWLHWSAIAETTKSQGIYAVARDVTRRKEVDAERERLVSELRAALSEVKTLQSILPICSYCRKIRDDKDAWHSVEAYVSHHTDTRFSHGICPDCIGNLDPEHSDHEE